MGPSPPWMACRLEAAGMRPVNSIVDITNYVLLELGHPLHTFDYARLRGGKIVVARAAPGQKVTTLDGIERELDEEMLLINDGAGPVAIAGVMGGLESEISPNTRTVLLECAYFNPTSVRRTAKRLGLQTEASYRFERGADWDDTVRASARVCRLVEELAGGRVAGTLQDVYPAPKGPVVIELRRRHAQSLLGVRLTDRFIATTLARLEFRLEPLGRGAWRVTVPTYRADMELEADVIEELARFYGYDRIPTTLPAARKPGAKSPAAVIENGARAALLGMGYHEAVNLSFAAESDLQQFPPGAAGGASIRVVNPLTEETRFLRTTLAAGLVKAVKHNLNHGNHSVRLFEIGKVFHADPSGEPRERKPSGGYTFFHLKGAVSALAVALRAASAEVVPEAGVAWLNPAVAGRLVVGGEALGVLGGLHPDLEEAYKLRQQVYLAEIDFELLARCALQPVEFRSLPKYPAVERDLSVVVPDDLGFAAIHRGIAGLGMAELVTIDLIDVYEGEKIPPGKRSMTLRLKFQARDRTLTVDQVQTFSDNVVQFLRGDCGAELR
ncbi:MAG: phenylalanine--tRNA ligase subunit beta [Acidobacteria bacterium]|nr:MAG: phenylalanine--tRNA ligase subunit beta [Acidobacteriota bacterium]